LPPTSPLLPINGRDEACEAAGRVGNLAPVEAVQLRVAVGAGVLVPMHHDAAGGDTGDLASFVQGRRRSPHLLLPARERPLLLPAPGR
jgi:hypothetical protein